MADLEELLYSKLIEDTTLADYLATFDNEPALFYRQVPMDTAPEWATEKYPRVAYAVDYREDPEHRVAGSVVFFIWSLTSQGAVEPIEARLRAILDGAFFHPETDPAVALKWFRTDIPETEQNELMVSTVVAFDLLAFPDQLTFDPDPVQALNNWVDQQFSTQATVTLQDTAGSNLVLVTSKAYGTEGNELRVTVEYVTATEKQVKVYDGPDLVEFFQFVASTGPGGLDEAERFTQRVALDGSDYIIVTWLSKGNSILQPGTFVLSGGTEAGIQVDPTAWLNTDPRPVLYWRVSGIERAEIMNWGGWLTVRVHGHVISSSPSKRLEWTKRLIESLVRNPRVKFPDEAPLDLLNLAADTSVDQFKVGQLRVTARFGVLRPFIEAPVITQTRTSDVALTTVPVPEE